MQTPITHNEEPAEVIPDGFRFVSTMLSPSPGKEEDMFNYTAATPTSSPGRFLAIPFLHFGHRPIWIARWKP